MSGPDTTEKARERESRFFPDTQFDLPDDPKVFAGSDEEFELLCDWNGPDFIAELRKLDVQLAERERECRRLRELLALALPLLHAFDGPAWKSVAEAIENEVNKSASK